MQTEEKPWKWVGIGVAVGLILIVVLGCVGLVVLGPSLRQHASFAALAREFEAIVGPRPPVAVAPPPTMAAEADLPATPAPLTEAVETPTPEVKSASTPTPEASDDAPEADTPVPGGLDTTDATSAVAWLIDLVEQREAHRVTSLVGPDGAAVVPYGVSADYLGYDNGDEIAWQLDRTLAQSAPVLEGCDICIGCMPDKITVWYTGVASLDASTGDCIGTGFNIWERDGRWQLVFITCLEWDDWVLSTLDDCAALP